VRAARVEDQQSNPFHKAATAARPKSRSHLALALSLCLLALPGCSALDCQSMRAATGAARLVVADYETYLELDLHLEPESKKIRAGTARSFLEMLERLEAEACE